MRQNLKEVVVFVLTEQLHNKKNITLENVDKDADIIIDIFHKRDKNIKEILWLMFKKNKDVFYFKKESLRTIEILVDLFYYDFISHDMKFVKDEYLKEIDKLKYSYIKEYILPRRLFM